MAQTLNAVERERLPAFVKVGIWSIAGRYNASAADGLTARYAEQPNRYCLDGRHLDGGGCAPDLHTVRARLTRNCHDRPTLDRETAL